MKLKIGLLAEKSEVVSANNTAISYGSGSIAVYATPAMIGLMEGAAIKCVDDKLEGGLGTVGISLNVRHLAATPIGMSVTATAELIEIVERKLVFKVTAFDNNEKIGEGIHERFIIKIDKFLTKCNNKKQ